MDNQKFGKFIKEQRQNLGITQKELGDKLNVTDKAVSKWERGLSFPDITIIEPLAAVFKISTAELISAEVGQKEEIDIEKAVNDAIEQYKNIKELRKKRLRIIRIIFGILSLIIFVLSCIVNGAYLFVFRSKNYEYVVDSIVYIINEITIVSGFISAMFLMKGGKCRNIVSSTLLVITTAINFIFMSNNVTDRACIVSFSKNMKSELVLKVDKKSGQIDYYRDAKFFLWAKKRATIEYGCRGNIRYQWIENDICVIMYKDNDKFLRCFVATYGTRAEKSSMSYYSTASAIYGDWQSENDNKIFVSDGKIRVKIDGTNEIFDTSECEQYGDSAIVLYKGSIPMYAIGLNRNCTVAGESYIVKDGGTITLLKILEKPSVPEEFVCVTYKNDNQLDNYNPVQVEKNGYLIKDKKLYVSYDGEHSIVVPGIYENRRFAQAEYQVADYKTFFHYTYNNKSFFVYSDDMGKTWSQQEIEAISSIKAITFPSEKIGYMLVFDDVAAGYAVGRIMKTEDGGRVWTPVFYGFGEDTPKIFGIGSEMTFVDENVGFVTLLTANHNACELYITKDGAKSFEKVEIPQNSFNDANYDYYNLPYVDEDGIWCVKVSQGDDAERGSEPRIYRFDEDWLCI